MRIAIISAVRFVQLTHRVPQSKLHTTMTRGLEHSALTSHKGVLKHRSCCELVKRFEVPLKRRYAMWMSQF
jgi:hypothetical protein